MPASLFKDLAKSGWHSSIMTSYSVDPAFYDGSIAHRLRAFGCENNILLADAVMLKRALNAMPEAFQQAGRSYAVVPVQMAGCFHPKIHLRLGSNRARLVVGSANATAAGWGGNHEIVSAMEWHRGVNDNSQALGSLIKRAYDYLGHWLQTVPGDAVDFKLRLHRKDAPWLPDLTLNVAPIALSDGTAIDLLCDRGGDDPSILERYLGLVAGHVPKRLVIVSPYWDADLAGLREMRERLGNCPTFVALNPQRNRFPVASLEKGATVSFCALYDGEDGHRFLHAKAILIQTAKADHILYGSANCSDDALGGIGKPSRNAEVSVYRRLGPGEGLTLLGIDLSRTIGMAEIQPPEPSAKLFPGGGGSVPGGYVESVQEVLTWWPPHHCDPTGARILLGDSALPLEPSGIGQYRAQISTKPNYPVVVRIGFADGCVSDPLIVHDELALRRAAPGSVDRRLRVALDRILRGEEDIVDLALNAHLLFEPDAGAPSGGSGRKTRDAPKTEGADYATPEDFRRGVALRPATGDTGRSSVDDPGLLDVLRIVLHGVIDVGGRYARSAAERDEDATLLAGESEDGDEGDEAPSVPEPRTESRRDAAERVFTPEEIARRRAQLFKAIDGFEEMLDRLAAGRSAISTRLTAQAAFIVKLMLYACTSDQKRSDGEVVRLMAWAPDGAIERDETFAVRAGRILQRVWLGRPQVVPIALRMDVDRRGGILPDDIFYFIVMSRWAIVRATLGTAAAASLAPILRKRTIEIYASTMRFGPVDSDAELSMLQNLDRGLGFSETETQALVAAHRENIRKLSTT